VGGIRGRALARFAPMNLPSSAPHRASRVDDAADGLKTESGQGACVTAAVRRSWWISERGRGAPPGFGDVREGWSLDIRRHHYPPGPAQVTCWPFSTRRVNRPSAETEPDLARSGLRPRDHIFPLIIHQVFARLRRRCLIRSIGAEAGPGQVGHGNGGVLADAALRWEK